jgi:hypothetical protein
MLGGLQLTGHLVCGLLYLESFLEYLLTCKSLFIEEIGSLVKVGGGKGVSIEFTQIGCALEAAGKEVVELFLNLREVFHNLILIIIDSTHYCCICHIYILDLSGRFFDSLDLIYGSKEKSLFFE